MDPLFILYSVGVAIGFLAGYNYHKLNNLLFDEKGE